MTEKTKKILVLCTGNSCRSIMAEALINQLCAPRIHAVSAGSHPTGHVHPKSLETLARHHISPFKPRSKSWDEFTDSPFDMVITVCDQAAAESCPVFSGAPEKRHWSIPDPASVTGPDTVVDAAFDKAFALLKHRIETELK